MTCANHGVSFREDRIELVPRLMARLLIFLVIVMPIHFLVSRRKALERATVSGFRKKRRQFF
jgi:heme A synthase